MNAHLHDSPLLSGERARARGLIRMAVLGGHMKSLTFPPKADPWDKKSS